LGKKYWSQITNVSFFGAFFIFLLVPQSGCSFFMDARGDLVGPRPMLQQSTSVCPHPVAFGIVGSGIPQNFHEIDIVGYIIVYPMGLNHSGFNLMNIEG
jgi:hypothetical protein